MFEVSSLRRSRVRATDARVEAATGTEGNAGAEIDVRSFSSV